MVIIEMIMMKGRRVKCMTRLRSASRDASCNKLDLVSGLAITDTWILILLLSSVHLCRDDICPRLSPHLRQADTRKMVIAAHWVRCKKFTASKQTTASEQRFTKITFSLKHSVRNCPYTIHLREFVAFNANEASVQLRDCIHLLR